MNYNHRKRTFSTLTISQVFGVVVIVAAVYVLTLLFPHRFALQYLDENKELQTEVFNSAKEYNKRAEELRQDSMTLWRD